MVATLNITFSRYWSTCKNVNHEQELVQEMASAVVQAIYAFRNENKIDPQRLVFMMFLLLMVGKGSVILKGKIY